MMKLDQDDLKIIGMDKVIDVNTLLKVCTHNIMEIEEIYEAPYVNCELLDIMYRIKTVSQELDNEIEIIKESIKNDKR